MFSTGTAYSTYDIFSSGKIVKYSYNVNGVIIIGMEWIFLKKYEKIDVLSKFGPCTYVRLIIQMDVI